MSERPEVAGVDNHQAQVEGDASAEGGAVCGLARRTWLLAGTPGLVLAAFLCVFPMFAGGYYTHVAIIVFLNITLALGYRLLCLTGLYSFCHITFYAVGAYTSALLTVKLGAPVWLAFLAAGAVAALAAMILIVPAARVRGVYFFLVSFGFLGVMDSVLTHWTGLTGGDAGVIGIPSLVGSGTPQQDYFIVLAFALVTIFIMWRIERSRFGRELKPIGNAERLAAVCGVNVLKNRVLAFAIGGAFAGLAGSLFAHDAAYIAPTNFTMWGTIFILVWLVIGGERKMWGPIVGAVLMTLVAELLRMSGMLQALLYSGALLVAIMFMPHGIVGLVDTIKGRFGKRETGPQAGSGEPTATQEASGFTAGGAEEPVLGSPQ
jgi:branched-chain amino acid transport system permease protein